MSGLDSARIAFSPKGAMVFIKFKFYHIAEYCTGFAFRFEHRKWNRGRNRLHQLGQPVGPSIPVFKSEGEPGIV